MRYSKYIFSCVMFLGLGCMFNKVQSQNIGPYTLDNQSLFTYYSSPVTVLSPSSFTIGNGDYEIYSNGSVTMLPGFVAKTTPSSNGFYVAEHATSLPQPELFGIDLNNVVQYEKLEVGISLPSLHARISEFLNDATGIYKVASTGYNSNFTNGNILNPYDPDHISIEARFYQDASTVPIIRYGFFYKEFHRLPLGDPDGPFTDWEATYGDPDNPDPNEIDPFEWRIRFSPPETGSWKCMILVYVDGELQPEHYYFKFHVITGTDPGFVEICDNNQYLKFSNHYDSEDDQFFPVGDNYCFNMDAQGDGSCFALNCNGNVDDHRIKTDLFSTNKEYIDKLIGGTNGGGNSSRLIFAPWCFEVEFEKLGNYQTRQIEMFELDEYLKYASEKNVYLSISPLNGLMLRNIPDGLDEYSNYWPWHPYNSNHILGHIANYDPASDPYVQYKGITNVDDPIEFFTDPDAKRLFKNKLRYMDSRWGYSPHYYCNEISTEVDQHLDIADFWNNSSNNTNVVNWMNEMGSYLKNDLKAKQLVTLNYGFTPKPLDFEGPQYSNSSMWNSTNVDVVSIHDYNDQLGNMSEKSNVIINSLNLFDKPVFVCENDVWRTITICTSNCTEISIHNNLWSSAFSGSFCPGLHWEWRTELDLSDEYKALRNLFSYINLNFQDGYTPFHSVVTINEIYGTAFENFFLTKSGEPGNLSNKAYGWVHNRSFNEYTVGGCMNDIMEAEDNNPNIPYASKLRRQYENHWYDDNYNYHFPTPYLAYYKPQSTFHLRGLIPGAEYTIEYYYTSGSHIGEFDPNLNFTFVTYMDPTGEGHYDIINGPPTGGGLNPYTNEPYPADWAYVVHLSNEPRSHIADQNWNPIINDQTQNHLELSNVQFGDLDISVSPNPNDGSFVVQAKTNKAGSYRFALTDISGNAIQSQIVELIEGANRISFSNSTLAPGVYLMKVDGYTEVLKIVINN